LKMEKENIDKMTIENCLGLIRQGEHSMRYFPDDNVKFEIRGSFYVPKMEQIVVIDPRDTEIMKDGPWKGEEKPLWITKSYHEIDHNQSLSRWGKLGFIGFFARETKKSLWNHYWGIIHNESPEDYKTLEETWENIDGWIRNTGRINYQIREGIHFGCCGMPPQGTPSPHHRRLCELKEDIINGDYLNKNKELVKLLK